jgi:phosphoesterase RecJ-like protein
MVAEFAFECKLKMSQRIAEYLYLGICTDSGRFRYAPTNAKTHRIIARLLEQGVETDSIFKILYLSDEAYVKYQALLVSKFKRTKHNVVYCFADVPDYDQFGLKFDQISKNVNVIGNIRGCPIWVLFTRSPENFIRVEFRSHKINVQKVAAKYGGGGHLHAAGARLENQKDFALAMKVVEDLDKAAEEAEKE